MRLRSWIIAALCASSPATSAVASTDITQDPHVQKSLVIAYEKWGHHCTPSVEAVALDRNIGGVSWEQQCVIFLNTNHQYTLQSRCHVLVHEYGHLVGYMAKPGDEYVYQDGTVDPFHSNNPGSVMYPYLQAPYYFRCRLAQHNHEL